MTKPSSAARLVVITACIQRAHPYADRCLLENNRPIDTDRFTEIPPWCPLPSGGLTSRTAIEPPSAPPQGHPYVG